MGLLRSLKVRLSPAGDKVSGLAHRHGGEISHGLDKAAKVVDEKTKGKYSHKIHTGTGRAKDAMDRLAHRGDAGTGGGTVPPDTPTRPTP